VWFSAALAAVTTLGALVATTGPAAASYPCPGGYGCFYDTNPYNNSAQWRAPSCGDHDLRGIGWRDRISYAANWGGGNATLYNEIWWGWERVAVVAPGTGSRSFVGTVDDNVTDRIYVTC
jgi:hypothetical protein